MNNEENKINPDLLSVKLIRYGGEKRQEGISQLYQKYASPIKNYYLKRGVVLEQAEDLLQEVFIQIIRKIDSYHSEGSFSAWIWTIARNIFISDIRKSSNKHIIENLEENLETGVSAISPIDLVENEYQQCVQNAFKGFSLDHKERAHALTLSALYGWNIEEMSGYLGRTRAATREYLSQCRKKLQPFMKLCHEYLRP